MESGPKAKFLSLRVLLFIEGGVATNAPSAFCLSCFRMASVALVGALFSLCLFRFKPV